MLSGTIFHPIPACSTQEQLLLGPARHRGQRVLQVPPLAHRFATALRSHTPGPGPGRGPCLGQKPEPRGGPLQLLRRLQCLRAASVLGNGPGYAPKELPTGPGGDDAPGERPGERLGERTTVAKGLEAAHR